MLNIPNDCTIISIMYAQIYIRLDIAFTVRMLGRYQNNVGTDQLRAANKSDEIL